MKFKVSRTSDQPVTLTLEMKKEYKDAYKIKDFYKQFEKIQELNKKFNPNGYEILEFKDLKQLIKFCNKYGEIIISSKDSNDEYDRLEIYDDYRE